LSPPYFSPCRAASRNFNVLSHLLRDGTRILVLRHELCFLQPSVIETLECTRRTAMSKFVALSFAVAGLWFAAVQPAVAGECQYYGWYYAPSSSYYGWTYAPSAPVAAAPQQAPSAGETARADNGTYQSFSAEPNSAAPAASAPVTQAVPSFNAGSGSADYSQNNPGGASLTTPVTFGSFGNGSSVGSTQNNPSGGGSSVSPNFGGNSGGTSGGTAGRPY
jgi:hypothetical protein